jgi:hypothetical protein
MSKNLFKEAIADAKAVKETAIENAKAALEEAFTPHLKSMLSAKLSQLDESEDNVDEVEDTMYEMEDEKDAKKDNLDEMDLEEILRELESLEEMGDDEMKEESLEEAKDKEADKMKEEKDEKEKKKDMKEEVEDSEEETEEEFNIEDMSEDDLKAFVEDVISDMMASGEIEGGEDEEELNIDTDGEEAPIDELNIDELLAEVEALEEAKKKKSKKEEKEEKDEEKEKLKKDLKEALDTLEVLKEELNEINLLNAKLLYTNKIFKAKNLTESEKVKVLTTFDKASTVKEAKLVYETLLEGLTTKTKSTIKESLGSASKTIVTSSPKQPIIETNEVFARMQKLAGIK